MTIGTNSDVSDLQAVAVAVGGGDLAHAFQIASEALRKGRQHPAFYNARALRFQDQGRLPEALAEYQRALTMTPGDVNLLNAMGMCCAQMGDWQNAVAAFDAALSNAPKSVTSLYRKGWVHALAGEDDAAREAFERTLEAEPEHSDALASLAALCARGGDTETARTLAARSLERDPRQPTAIVALAIAEMDAGHHAQAEDLLRRALKDERANGRTKAILLGEIGRALEGQNKGEEAFTAYRMRGEELLRLHAKAMDVHALASKVMASRAAYIGSAPAEKWRAVSSPGGGAVRGHVFLVGFLSSGTYLIEHHLGVHPDVTLLSGRDTLGDLPKLYMDVPFGLDRLSTLGGMALDEAREGYWRRVRACGVEPDGTTFVDSQPVNAINLPLLARLFPDAKVVMALRDPRDTVLAAFTERYEVTPLTYELLDVASAARLYAAVMNLATLCRAKLPLEIIDLRYEDLLADTDGRLRALSDRLGLEPLAPEGSQNGQQRLRPEDEPGRWRRYEAQLADAMPALTPWIRHFGYTIA